MSKEEEEEDNLSTCYSIMAKKHAEFKGFTKKQLDAIKKVDWSYLDLSDKGAKKG